MQQLLGSFVLVADEVFRLQRGKNAESQAFQSFCEQGHYGNRSTPSRTRQGIYAITPAGSLLASINTRSSKRVVAMLRQALERWAEVPLAERVLPAEQHQQLLAMRRFEDKYPEDGLVLAEYLRDLDREVDAKDWRTQAWNEDQAWFTAAEAALFVPPATVGARHDVPARLVQRLVLLHLVDSVRGQTPPLPASAVDVQQLTSEVVAVDDQHIELRLRGKSHAAHRGKWRMGSDEPASEHERGVETVLRGRAKWHRSSGRFVAFELVAIGARWGATRFNERRDDEARSKIGFAFVLAASDHPRVAPAYWSRYRLR